MSSEMINIAIDHRSRLLEIRDQGRRPTCLSVSVSTAHEDHISHHEYLSVEYLHHHARILSGPRSDECAATLNGVQQAIQIEGQPNETSYPYAPDMANVREPHLIDEPLWRCNLLWKKIPANGIFQIIDEGKIAILAIAISEMFFQVDKSGIVFDDPSKKPLGNHAVLAVGHGRLTNGNRMLLIRNSWGAKWGLDGYAWLHEDCIDQRLFATGLITKLEADNENY